MAPLGVRKGKLQKKLKKEATLHHAASFGNIPKMMSLLSKGVNVNAIDVWGDTALHKAIQCGDFDTVKLLVREGADINFRRRDGDTALHLAAAFGLPDYVTYLIENGAVVEATAEDNITPLHKAVRHTNPECVKVLLKYGAIVNAVTCSGRTPLHFAVLKSSCIDILVEAGADIFVRDESNLCPLELAIEIKTDLFKKLLHQKFDVKDSQGTTTLHVASRCLNDECLVYLIASGCDVNVQNNNGDTPLHFACEMVSSCRNIRGIMLPTFTHCANVKLLVKAGAKIDQKNNMGLAPVHICAKFNNFVALSIIHELGGDLNLRGGDKNDTPLHFASEAGSLRCLDYLLANDVDKSSLNSENHTSLMLAAKNCHFACVKFLLRNDVPMWPAVNTL